MLQEKIGLDTSDLVSPEFPIIPISVTHLSGSAFVFPLSVVGVISYQNKL